MSTVTKALFLLDLFTGARPVIGLSAFQKQAGHDKATVYRQLRALEQAVERLQSQLTRTNRHLEAMQRRLERAEAFKRTLSSMNKPPPPRTEEEKVSPLTVTSVGSVSAFSA